MTDKLTHGKMGRRYVPEEILDIWTFITKLIKKIVMIILSIFIDLDALTYLRISVLPRAFIDTTKYRFAGVGLPLTNNEKKIVALHNIHYGKRAFIIGNGPSLNQCNLSLLKNEITFGVNNIFLNFDRMGFYPTYYVVEDILVAEDRANQINSYSGPRIKFFGNYLRYCIDDNQDICWLNIRVNYSNYQGFPHFSKNSARMIWTGGTVSYICMQLAYYMGFSNVYLVGFDHSYIIPTDAEINDHEKRIISGSDDPNHFNRNYFGKGFRWHFPNVERMELSYMRARRIFESDQRKIINATIGGNLNVFPRIDYICLFPS